MRNIILFSFLFTQSKYLTRSKELRFSSARFVVGRGMVAGAPSVAVGACVVTVLFCFALFFCIYQEAKHQKCKGGYKP